jgi:hypothetical protein
MSLVGAAIKAAKARRYKYPTVQTFPDELTVEWSFFRIATERLRFDRYY